MSDYYDNRGPDLPLFRDTDPETSRRAARSVDLKTKRARMLEAFRQLGTATSREAAEVCLARYGGEVESYRKRTGDLKQRGKIRQCGNRRCRTTGAMATVYEVAT